MKEIQINQVCNETAKTKKASFGFVALISQGDICYWENGLAVLDVLNSTKTP